MKATKYSKGFIFCVDYTILYITLRRCGNDSYFVGK